MRCYESYFIKVEDKFFLNIKIFHFYYNIKLKCRYVWIKQKSFIIFDNKRENMSKEEKNIK